MLARPVLRSALAVVALSCVPVAPVVARPGGNDGESAAARAARRNREGVHLLAEERLGEAVTAFGEARELLRHDVTIARNLAAALAAQAEAARRSSDLDEAVRLVERAIDLHPTRIHFRFLAGRIHLSRARDADRHLARRHLAWVLERDPDHRDSLVLLGLIAYQERELSGAVAFWRRAAALNPGDKDTRRRLAEAERELRVEASYEELRDPSFRVRFGPAVPRDRADRVLAICRTAHQELATWLDHHPEAATVVTLYSPAEFQTVTRLHAWVAGLSDGTIRLALSADTPMDSLRATIRHEYTHHLVRALAPRAPGWLHEGLAQLAENKSVTAAESRLARGGSPSVSELVANVLAQPDPRVVSRFYDLALGFTHRLQVLGGDRGIPSLLRGLGEGADEDELMRTLFGAPRDALFERWSAQLGTG